MRRSSRSGGDLERVLLGLGIALVAIPVTAAVLGYVAFDDPWLLAGAVLGSAILLVRVNLGWLRRTLQPLDAVLASHLGKGPSETSPLDARQTLELERARYMFESRKIRIGVEYSRLSTSSKDHCFALLDEAEDRLAKAESLEEVEALGDYIETAGQLKGVIARESRTLLIYTLVTIAILALVGWATWNGGNWEPVAYEKSVFGIPIAILVWSGIGGLVSVLFRYMFQQAEYKEPTFKALVIRPVVGIVLGTVTYFVLASGLFVLGDAQDRPPSTLRGTAGFLFLILAFLAGFSDRLAIFVLGSVAGRVGLMKDSWLPRESRAAPQDEAPRPESAREPAPSPSGARSAGGGGET